MLYRIQHSFSPIDRKRFNEEFRKRSENEATQVLDYSKTFRKPENELSYLAFAFLHPVKTVNLIKKYHQVGNLDITFYLLYLAVLLHLAIKAIVHTFGLTGTDELDFKLSFYPYWTPNRVVSSPITYHNLFSGFVALALWLRVKNFLKLIKESIVNAEKYKKLSKSQINFAYLAQFKLSMKEWFELWNHNLKHEKLIKDDQNTYKHHLKFNKTMQKNCTKYSIKDLIFYFNPIDFEECYRDFGMLARGGPSEKYANWFSSKPFNQLSPFSLNFLIFIHVLGNALCLVFGFMDVLVVAYIDLKSVYPTNEVLQVTKLISQILIHYSEPKYFIRYFEILIIISSQFPVLYETSEACFDALFLISKTSKLVAILEDNLSSCRAIKCHLIKLKKARISISQHLNEDLMQYAICNSSYNRLELNKQIVYNFGLIKLLYLDFLNIKQTHTMLLDIQLSIYGLCLSYGMSVISSQETEFVESILIAFGLATCIVPIVQTLTFFAYIESRVS